MQTQEKTIMAILAIIFLVEGFLLLKQICQKKGILHYIIRILEMAILAVVMYYFYILVLY